MLFLKSEVIISLAWSLHIVVCCDLLKLKDSFVLRFGGAGVQSAANEAELEAQLAELLPRGVPGSGGMTCVGQGPQTQPTHAVTGNGGHRQEIVYENVKSRGSGSQKADDKPPPEKTATDKEKVV